MDPGEAAVGLGVYFIVLLLNILYLGGEDGATPTGASIVHVLTNLMTCTQKKLRVVPTSDSLPGNVSRPRVNLTVTCMYTDLALN